MIFLEKKLVNRNTDTCFRKVCKLLKSKGLEFLWNRFIFPVERFQFRTNCLRKATLLGGVRLLGLETTRETSD